MEEVCNIGVQTCVRTFFLLLPMMRYAVCSEEEDALEVYNSIEHPQRIRSYDFELEQEITPAVEGRFSVKAHSFCVFRVRTA